jgi:outer membrane protein, multidrug efflux system
MFRGGLYWLPRFIRLRKSIDLIYPLKAHVLKACHGFLICAVVAPASLAHAADVLPPPTPLIFYEATAASNSTPVPVVEKWWAIFADPALDQLIARAEKGNTDIQLAVARLSQARATLRGAAAAQLPQFNIGGNASKQTGALINAAGGGGTLYSIGGNLSYELDVLGRLSKGKKAARLDAAAAGELVRTAHLLIQADTALAYFEIRTLDEERAALADAAANERVALEILEARARNGLVSELDVVQARGALATISADLLALDRRRAEVEHSLAFLMGEPPSKLNIEGMLIASPPQIPADIPSAVLGRRADIAAAERRLGAATLRVGVAKASWLPQLSLTGSRGYASPSLGNLLQSATQNFGVGFLLSLPFLDGGRRAVAVKSANADVEVAAVEYRAQILTAFRDVENQLSAVRLLDAQSAVIATASAANLRAKDITEARHRNGMISRLEVLEANRTQLQSARDAVQNKFARYAATIGLVRALGGGWSGMNSAAKLGAVGGN